MGIVDGIRDKNRRKRGQTTESRSIHLPFALGEDELVAALRGVELRSGGCYSVKGVCA
jgi:hypothetical protein